MAFAIYEVAIGAGRVALSPIPRDAAHVDSIRAWAPALVVGLTEESEGEIPEHADLDWVRVPITDYGIPMDNALDEIIARAVLEVREGHRVLFHCKGGCGRSGMAVLRAMHLMGISDALAVLRAVRPCAVETEAQLNWALRP
jgi:protein-tyrosine phosphatase